MYALIWTWAACAINPLFPLEFTKLSMVWHKISFMEHPRMILEQISCPLYLKKCKNLSFSRVLNIVAIYGLVILICLSRLLIKSRDGSVIQSILNRHFVSSHILTNVMWFSSVCSTKIFMATAQMSYCLWCHDFKNLFARLDWHLGTILYCWNR